MHFCFEMVREKPAAMFAIPFLFDKHWSLPPSLIPPPSITHSGRAAHTHTHPLALNGPTPQTRKHPIFPPVGAGLSLSLHENLPVRVSLACKPSLLTGPHSRCHAALEHPRLFESCWVDGRGRVSRERNDLLPGREGRRVFGGANRREEG